MAGLVRIVLWMAWALGVGALWHTGVLGLAGTAAALAVGVMLALRPRGPRQRRGQLRYVEMGKRPLGP